MMDYIILGIIFLGIGIFVYRRVTKKSSSCGSCSGCNMADSCPSNTSESKK